MGLKVSAGADYVPPPAGTFRAICTGIVDMGTQKSEQYGPRRQVLMTWEIDERADDGTPYRVHRRFTQSLHEKSSLRGMLQGWRGRAFTDIELEGFDLRNVLGKPCMVSVIHATHDSRTYANVSAVSAMPKGLEPLSPSGEPVSFDLDAPDEKILAMFADKLQEQIRAAPEYAASKKTVSPIEESENPEPGADTEFDNLPF